MIGKIVTDDELITAKKKIGSALLSRRVEMNLSRHKLMKSTAMHYYATRSIEEGEKSFKIDSIVSYMLAVDVDIDAVCNAIKSTILTEFAEKNKDIPRITKYD